jgi:hypothetical protein
MTKKNVFILSGTFFFCAVSFSQAVNHAYKPGDFFPSIDVEIKKYLDVFNEDSTAGVYRISLCADVPNNKKPYKVAYQQETGHVFLILRKITTHNDTISKVFGFYPKGGLQTLLFKKTKSYIEDNSFRDHDVAITKELTREQFDTVLAKSIKLSERKYHMNRYNCYDYAIQIYNSVAGGPPLPLRHIRFPFIFGKGGSPCGVYRDLLILKDLPGYKDASIQFGSLLAPRSTGRSL